MKIWDVIRTVGTGLISATVPGAGLLIGAVNEFLPDSEKLPATATGTDLQAAVAAMPAAERAALVAKEFDVEIIEVQESHSTLRAMLESDARNPHTTRPFIAKWSFIVVALITVLIVIMWSYAVAMQDAPLVKEIASGWAFVAAALAPFVWLLKSYFGTLTAEHRDRLGAAGGNPIAPPGLAGLIASFVKK